MTRAIWGPFAVACVWLVAQPMLVGFVLTRIRRTLEMPISEYLLRLKAPLICSGLMVGVVVFAREFTAGMTPVLHLITLSTLGATVYVCAFRALFNERITAILAILRTRN